MLGNLSAACNAYDKDSTLRPYRRYYPDQVQRVCGVHRTLSNCSPAFVSVIIGRRHTNVKQQDDLFNPMQNALRPHYDRNTEIPHQHYAVPGTGHYQRSGSRPQRTPDSPDLPGHHSCGT